MGKKDYYHNLYFLTRYQKATFNKNLSENLFGSQLFYLKFFKINNLYNFFLYFIYNKFYFILTLKNIKN